jgi:hypothetical protein
MKNLSLKSTNYRKGFRTNLWRVAFAFDPKRRAIVLVAGDKGGTSQKRFYKQLIAKADNRFGEHLSRLKEEGEKGDGEES